MSKYISPRVKMYEYLKKLFNGTFIPYEYNKIVAQTKINFGVSLQQVEEALEDFETTELIIVDKQNNKIICPSSDCNETLKAKKELERLDKPITNIDSELNYLLGGKK